MIHVTQVLLLALIPPPALQEPAPDADVRARYHALHAKGDREGCAALWKGAPSAVLPALEQDLDEALSLRQAAESEAKGQDAPVPAAAREMEQRALWGARVARDALGAPLIADQVAARVGWSAGERRHLGEARAMQARAREHLDNARNREALIAAQETVARSLALADWHGAAVAYEAFAAGNQGLGSLDEALIAWSQARVIYRELAMTGKEQECLRSVLDLCYATDRATRGRETADQALVDARQRGDRKTQADLLRRRAGFEEKLGLKAEAEATKKELEALAKD